MSIFPHEKVTLTSPRNRQLLRSSKDFCRSSTAGHGSPDLAKSCWTVVRVHGDVVVVWSSKMRGIQTLCLLIYVYIYNVLFLFKKNIWPYDNGLTLCYHWSYRTEANLPSPVHFFHLESSLSIPGRPTPGHLLLSRGQLGISYSTLPKFLQHSIEKTRVRAPLGMMIHQFNGNYRIPKWRYCTI